MIVALPSLRLETKKLNGDISIDLSFYNFWQKTKATILENNLPLLNPEPIVCAIKESENRGDYNVVERINYKRNQD